MNCRKCGSAIPQGSKFCANCGTPVISRELINQQPAPTKKKTALWAILAALAAVALIILLFLFLRGKPVIEPPTHAVVEQSPVLTVPNAPAPDKKPPADVVAFLEHLKKIDKERLELQKTEIITVSNMVATSTSDSLKQAFANSGIEGEDTSIPSQADKTKETVDKLTNDWDALLAKFNSLQPPAACAQLAGQYSNALGLVVKRQVGIIVAIQKLDLNADALKKGQSSDIDDALESSDTEVKNVCTKYGIKKDFTISSDRGGAPSLLQ
jgi:hypothetical protein